MAYQTTYGPGVFVLPFWAVRVLSALRRLTCAASMPIACR